MATRDAITSEDVASRTRPWVFDADGHVVEPPRVWDELLPARFRDYAPRVLQSEDHYRFACGDRVGFRIEGRSEAVGAPGQTPKRSDAPVAARGGSDPAPRLIDMAVDHIDAAALYPTYGLMIQGVTEREPALALSRAVNAWLAEYCSHAPDRLIGIGTLPMTDAGDALAEARRCVENLGFRGVWRRPEHFGALPRLQDDTYEPLWSYLEDAGVPFGIHPGMSGLVPFDELERRYDGYFSPLHAVHFPMEQMMALTTFVAYGILERHPKLRVAFLESGAVWALSYLHRLDEHLELFGFDRGALSMPPSEYFRRQCFVSVEEVEPGLGHAGRVSRIGRVRVRLPACRRDVSRLHARPARDPRPQQGGDPSCPARQRSTAVRTRRMSVSDWSDMEVFDAIFGLRATRVYEDRPVPHESLARILKAATRACSSGNTQPWEFVVVTDRDVKRELKAIMVEAFANIDHERAQSADELVDGSGRQVTGHAAIASIDVVSALVFVFWNPDRGIRMKGEYEANADGTLRPTRHIPGGRGSSLYPACQNMMLAAHALGVSSLFTTFFGLAEARVKEILHVPPRMFLEAAVFLGYGAEKLGKPRRKPLEEVVHLNDWDVRYEPEVRLP